MNPKKMNLENSNDHKQPNQHSEFKSKHYKHASDQFEAQVARARPPSGSKHARQVKMAKRDSKVKTQLH